MRLYPRDLGGKWHVALIQRRAGIAPGTEPANTHPPGFLGRLWTRDSGLDPEDAGRALAAVLRKSERIGHFLLAPVGFVVSLIVIGIVGELLRSFGLGSIESVFTALFGTGFPMTLLLGWIAFAAAGMPGIAFRRMDGKPLAHSEIDELTLTRRAVEREYLSLLADALEQKVAPEVESGLRQAIRALGDALDRLPDMSPLAGDGEALVAEARIVRAKAETETDPVIHASLMRQTEALLRSAEAGERGILVARRAEALREEMRAQARALRAGIVAYHNTVSDATALTMLADSVRLVAAEAQSVANAREEIDAFVAADAQADPIRLRRQ